MGLLQPLVCAGREVDHDLVHELFEGLLRLLADDAVGHMQPCRRAEHRLASEGGAFNATAELFYVGADLAQGLGYVTHNSWPVVADKMQFKGPVACCRRRSAAGLDRDPQA
jgi:hypothetical protein